MAARTSKLQRAIEFFRTAHPDEARVAFTLVKEIMDGRMRTTPAAHKSATRKRTARKPPAIPPPMAKAAAATGESLADA